MEQAAKNPIRILLVDDEEDLVTFLAHRLLKRGYTVAATTSGPEALEAVQHQKFDVAILDLKMPQMDGIQVLESIRKMQPFMEAIMLTGHGTHESALEAGRLHAFSYLIKPYDYEELLQQIQNAYEHKEAQLTTRFKEELDKIIKSGGSSREIINATEELRRKYDLE